MGDMTLVSTAQGISYFWVIINSLSFQKFTTHLPPHFYIFCLSYVHNRHEFFKFSRKKAGILLVTIGQESDIACQKKQYISSSKSV